MKLKGKTILVTRPASQAKRAIADLRRAGAKVIHIPLIEIADPSDRFRSLDRAISRLDEFDWLIFTSQNAVSKFFERLARPVRPGLARWRQKFAAVGPATADALRRRGIKKVIVPRKNNYSAEGLVDVLRRYDFRDKRVLFPSARKARETLPLWLKKRGARLKKVQAYQTIMPRNIDRARLKRLIRENKVDVVMFHSKSAEMNFRKIMGTRAIED